MEKGWLYGPITGKSDRPNVFISRLESLEAFPCVRGFPKLPIDFPEALIGGEEESALRESNARGYLRKYRGNCEPYFHAGNLRMVDWPPPRLLCLLFVS